MRFSIAKFWVPKIVAKLFGLRSSLVCFCRCQSSARDTVHHCWWNCYAWNCASKFCLIIHWGNDISSTALRLRAADEIKKWKVSMKSRGFRGVRDTCRRIWPWQSYLQTPFGSFFVKVILQSVILKYEALLHGPRIPSIPNVSQWLACKDVMLQLGKAWRSNCITTVVTEVNSDCND